MYVLVDHVHIQSHLTLGLPPGISAAVQQPRSLPQHGFPTPVLSPLIQRIQKGCNTATLGGESIVFAGVYVLHDTARVVKATDYTTHTCVSFEKQLVVSVRPQAVKYRLGLLQSPHTAAHLVPPSHTSRSTPTPALATHPHLLIYPYARLHR